MQRAHATNGVCPLFSIIAILQQKAKTKRKRYSPPHTIIIRHSRSQAKRPDKAYPTLANTRSKNHTAANIGKVLPAEQCAIRHITVSAKTVGKEENL